MTNTHNDFNKFMDEYLNDDNTKFDVEMEGINAYIDATAKSSKQKGYNRRNDGHGMIDDLDKYMTSEPGQGDRQDIVYDGPHNVWSYLKGEGYSRADIEYINVTYNNILNYIDTLEVKLITGDVLFFENIQLV